MDIQYYCENVPDCGKPVSRNDQFLKIVDHQDKNTVRDFKIACSWDCLIKISEVQSGQVISRTIRATTK